VLSLPNAAHLAMVAHALDGLPDEACGLIVGRFDDEHRATCVRFEPCRNVAASAKLYTIDPRDHLHIDRAADDEGLAVIGVMHSHTHTEPYPSPTDVAQAPDPGWHYVIVSLRHAEARLRSFRMIDGEITEEPVVVN